MKRILFIEDDPTIRSALTFSLEREGYQVENADKVKDALNIKVETFDLILLDIGLPDGSGYELCRAYQGRGTPILILSALDDEPNVVMGLELGAVDYVTKPFRLRELLTRIRGILQRSEKQTVTSFTKGSVRLDSQSAKVFKDDEEIVLSALEYRLLLLFFTNKGHVMSRDQIFASLWDIDAEFISDNTLTVYVKRIREKLDMPDIIETVRGIGYVLNP
ncbi:MAG TPA: response regulator transcription factor [Fastidiosipila sp.]|nr:response regulator transcription factor [Fastidiosipila sp.]